MPFRKFLFGLAPAAALGLVPPTANATVVYCTAPGWPAGCVVRTAPRVVAEPAAVVVPPAPVYTAPRPVAPRSAINIGGPINRAGVR